VAHLLVGGDDLRVVLSFVERIGAFVGEGLSVPLTAVRDARATTDPWADLRGMRAPGTGIPRVIALGIWRHSFGRDFVAVYGGGPAVIVDLVGTRFARLVVSDRRAEALAAEIRSAAAAARAF
jgi:hypothetical protein